MTPDWYIESSSEVYAVESVKASLVKVDEPCCALISVTRTTSPDTVVGVRSEAKASKADDDLFDVIPYGGIGLHEFVDYVVQHGTRRPQREKHRGASGEGFEVGGTR